MASLVISCVAFEESTTRASTSRIHTKHKRRGHYFHCAASLQGGILKDIYYRDDFEFEWFLFRVYLQQHWMGIHSKSQRYIENTLFFPRISVLLIYYISHFIISKSAATTQQYGRKQPAKQHYFIIITKNVEKLRLDFLYWLLYILCFYAFSVAVLMIDDWLLRSRNIWVIALVGISMGLKLAVKRGHYWCCMPHAFLV